MLLYSLLHLTGYDLSLDDLQRFRQWGSRTPGHPESGLTPGVEATTGPLGQGFANAVGMAIAERRLAAEFNRPGHAVVDHWTYAICSDGDLQEGIASEAASLAGHLRLGKLVFLWDDNRIQLDGPTSMAWSEDVLARFGAYGWQTSRVERRQRPRPPSRRPSGWPAPTTGPSLIAVRTHIGYGSPNKQDSQKAHGAPLGADEVRLTKEAYGWDPDRTFYVPDAAEALFSRAIPWGDELVGRWETAMARYEAAHPALAAELRRRLDGDLRRGWDAGLKRYAPGEDFATRQASQQAIAALAEAVPELFGGSADLSESNLTDVRGGGDFTADEAGRNLRFGVREHAMGGVVNGIACHGGFLPYAATFMTFSDYMRGSVRIAALAGLHVVYVWTHDSVGLGEDGPTHQPVEQAAALRAMPGLWVVRPGDANETAAGWALAVERATGPTALAPHPPEAADPARDRRARPRRRPAGRLRPPASLQRGRRRWPGARPRRHRQRAGARRRRGRGARSRRDRDAGRQPALPRGVRGPGRGLPRGRPAGRRPEARDCRGGRHVRLGSLRGRRGRDDRPRPFRRLGARPGADGRLRLHGRARRRGRPGGGGGRAPRPGSAAGRGGPARDPLRREG